MKPKMMKVRIRAVADGEPQWPAVMIYNRPLDMVRWVECSHDPEYLEKVEPHLNEAARRSLRVSRESRAAFT